MEMLLIGFVLLVLIFAVGSIIQSQKGKAGPHDQGRNSGHDSGLFFMNDGVNSQSTYHDSSESPHHDSSGGDSGGAGDSGGGGDAGGGGGD